MTARDIPGIGDTGNPFGYVPPGSPDFVDHHDEDAEALASNIEAFREWSESFIAAAEEVPPNTRRMEQSRFFVISCMKAIEERAAK
jgi:hypothetical protein